MKVAFYTHPHYLDTALPRIEALSRLVELHVLLEVAPEGWRSCIFDQSRRDLPSGLIDANGLFDDPAWNEVRRYWKNAASFRAVVHNQRRSVHPSSWKTSYAAAKAIQSLNPDILHIDDVSLRLAWTSIASGAIPQILTINDVRPHEGETNWRTRLAYSLVKKKSDRFIVHSKHQKRLLCSTSPISQDKVSAVPIGVLDIYTNWGGDTRRQDRPTILFFGRLSPYKGLDVLFEAAPLIAAAIPNLRIVVAGRPVAGYTLPQPPQLESGAQIDVLSDYASNSRLSTLFQQADVVVCPYTDATQSGVVLTAYAFDKPVVATCVGGLPEYINEGKTGYLVPPRDAAALADRVVRILSDTSMYQAMLKREVASLRAGALSWDAIARATVDVYSLARAEERCG